MNIARPRSSTSWNTSRPNQVQRQWIGRRSIRRVIWRDTLVSRPAFPTTAWPISGMFAIPIAMKYLLETNDQQLLAITGVRCQQLELRHD